MDAILKNPFLQYLFGFLPKVKTVILATVCFALGLLFAYSTVSWVDGDPSRLHQSWQDQWALGIAARLRSPSVTEPRDTPQILIELLSAIDNPVEVVDRLKLTPLSSLAEQSQASAPSTPSGGGVVSNIILPIVWIVVFVIVYSLLFFLWAFLGWPYVRDRFYRGESVVSDEAAKAETLRLREARMLEEKMSDQALEASPYGDPVMRKPSLYRAGFGNYDDSFNIETEDGMYYGESGASIAETLGEGQVTAIEIWMFDKDEFANTPTGLFVSEYASTDQEIRARLEARGEVLVATPDTKLILETKALYVEASVISIKYNEDAEHPNSVIQEMATHIVVWSKAGVVDQGDVEIPTVPSAATLTNPISPPTLPNAPGTATQVSDPLQGGADWTPINPIS